MGSPLMPKIPVVPPPDKTYRVNEIFYSIQGEGGRVGEPSIFVRFSGCDMACDLLQGPKSPGGFKCDTEFTSGTTYTLTELLEEIRRISSCKWLVLTGGEPLLQVDERFVAYLRREGFFIALETNGAHKIPPGLNWVCVSPKVAEHALEAQHADELRYVRAKGQPIPKPRLQAIRYFISPACSPEGFLKEDVDWCLKLVLDNPQWSLSLQLHKIIGVR